MCSNPAALERAFAGATGVYLVSPPDMAANDFIRERNPLLDKVARAAAAAQVPHVVLLSSIGAQQAAGTGPIMTLRHGEQALRAAGVPATFLRAAYFVENWASVLPVAKKDGVLPSFIKADAPIFMVSTPDIGRTAARALLDGPRGTRIIELAGPREVSPVDVAQAVSRLLGRPIKVVEAPLEAVVPTFTSFGISANVAGLYRDMLASMRKGAVVPEGKGAELVRGTIEIDETLARLLA